MLSPINHNPTAVHFATALNPSYALALWGILFVQDVLDAFTRACATAHARAQALCS